MNSKPVARALAVSLLTLPLVIGCQRLLDLDGLAGVVNQGIQDQLGLTVSDLKCPDDVVIEKGNDFDCAATVEGGGVLSVAITQNDDEGNITWEVVDMDGILDLQVLAGQIEQGVAQQAGVEVDVDCGGKLRAARPGDSFQCSVKDGAGTATTATVTVDDEDGNVSWKLD